MQKRILCNCSGIVSQCNNIMVHSHVPHSMTRECIQDIIVPQWLTRWHDQEHRNRLLSSICPLSIHKIHPLKPNHCHCIIHRETMATNVAMVVFTTTNLLTAISLLHLPPHATPPKIFYFRGKFHIYPSQHFEALTDSDRLTEGASVNLMMVVSPNVAISHNRWPSPCHIICDFYTRGSHKENIPVKTTRSPLVTSICKMCRGRTMNIELWSTEGFKLAHRKSDWHQTLVHPSNVVRWMTFTEDEMGLNSIVI